MSTVRLDSTTLLSGEPLPAVAPSRPAGGTGFDQHLYRAGAGYSDASRTDDAPSSAAPNDEPRREAAQSDAAHDDVQQNASRPAGETSADHPAQANADHPPPSKPQAAGTEAPTADAGGSKPAVADAAGQAHGAEGQGSADDTGQSAASAKHHRTKARKTATADKTETAPVPESAATATQAGAAADAPAAVPEDAAKPAAEPAAETTPGEEAAAAQVVDAIQRQAAVPAQPKSKREVQPKMAAVSGPDAAPRAGDSQPPPVEAAAKQPPAAADAALQASGDQHPAAETRSARRKESAQTAAQAAAEVPAGEEPATAAASDALAAAAAVDLPNLPDVAPAEDQAAAVSSPTIAPDAAAAAIQTPAGTAAEQKQAVAESRGGADQHPQVDRARFVDRVSRAFEALGERSGTVRLRLSPPELGSLRVEIEIQNGALSARLEAETPAARNLLLEHLPDLRERLAQQDIRVERFDVDLMDHNAGGGSGQAQQSDSFAQPRQQSPRGSGPAGAEHGPAAVSASAGAAPRSLSGEGSRLNVVI